MVKGKFPFSLVGLIRWLESKQPKGKYPYANPHWCLSAQFSKAAGRKQFAYGVLPAERRYKGEPFEETLERIAFGLPHTFGGALGRAKRTKPHF